MKVACAAPITPARSTATAMLEDRANMTGVAALATPVTSRTRPLSRSSRTPASAIIPTSEPAPKPIIR